MLRLYVYIYISRTKTKNIFCYALCLYRDEDHYKLQLELYSRLLKKKMDPDSLDMLMFVKTNKELWPNAKKCSVSWTRLRLTTGLTLTLGTRKRIRSRSSIRQTAVALYTLDNIATYCCNIQYIVAIFNILLQYAIYCNILAIYCDVIKICNILQHAQREYCNHCNV